MKPRALWFIVLGLVVAAILFAWLRPPPDRAPAPAVISQTPTGPSVPIAPDVPVAPPPVASSFDFVVRNGARAAGPVAMQAKEGDDVEIKVTSDQPDELHVHGYDLHTPLKANEPGTLYFKATHSGRFDVELHRSGLTLGALEIQPK
ncbi:MAG TPA: hypothetical protein VFB36_07315 [Nevskiaceae bacterium]|nr:hypothetical protein [Nevskiaceae bacterium]